MSLEFATDLINTTGNPDRLADLDALDALVKEWEWTGDRTGDESELRAVRALRPKLRELWETGEDRIVEIVNRLLRDANAVPHLVKHDGWDYHMHATPPSAPLATRMAVDVAMAMIDVVRTKELSRLRICDYQGCGNVVVDLTKNRSKRFCDDGCGNRAAVTAYRARKAELEEKEKKKGRVRR